MTLADKIEERIRAIKAKTSNKTYGDVIDHNVLRLIALEAADVVKSVIETHVFGQIPDTEDEEDEVDRLICALDDIKSWSEAYPLDVFPEPDLKKAAEVLKANGMTIDAISAHVARHVIDGVGKIAREALEPASS